MSKADFLPVFNMERRLKKHSEKIISAFTDVLKSGQIVLGKHVDLFEQNFAEYVGVRNCIGVGNGTDAIELALRSLELKAGSVVGITANAGGYSRVAIESAGYLAVYGDVDEESHSLSIESVLKLIDLGVSVVVLTHLYGRVSPDSSQIAAACRQAGVWLIEDCAQAHGSRLQNLQAGNFGDLATFSFYPTKNLGGVGDGGCVTTNNDELADRVNKLRTYGWKEKYDVIRIGGRNSRIDAIQAAVLNALIPDLEEENNERRRIAKTLKDSLKSDFVDLVHINDEGCNFHLLIVRTQFREDLMEHLTQLEIGSAIHYPIPDHLQSAWKGEISIKLPTTERLAAEILSIPCFPGMSGEEIIRLIHALNSFVPKESLNHDI
jgi:aminotransferase EvaB